MDVDLGEILKPFKSKAPAELQEFLVSFEDLYDRKLWHQLTVKYLQFIAVPSAKPFLIPLFEQFVSLWEKRVRSSALAQIVILTARQYTDAKKAVEVVQVAGEKLKEDGDSRVLLSSELAHYKLALGDTDECRSLINECAKLLADSQVDNSIVHAAFYRVSTDYYKAKANYELFFKNAISYLNCVNLAELPGTEKVERAYDLAIAALLGETSYSFGELLNNPILDSLKGMQHEWLRNTLVAFHTGDIGKFDVLATNFTKLPILASNAGFLRQKICLMALSELVFKRPASHRNIPFEIISKETKLPVEEVEHLVMKALSLGLLKGKIDQVEQTVFVTWIQPRILDKSQIEDLSKKIADWKQGVAKLSVELDHVAVDLVGQ